MAENKIPVTFLQCTENSLPEEKIPGRWIVVTDKKKVYLDINTTTRLAFDNKLDGKTDADTLPVHIDEEGKLWVAPYILSHFTENKLGGIMGVHPAEQILASTQDLAGLDYRQFYVGQAYSNYPEKDTSGKASVLIPIAGASIPGLVVGPAKTDNEDVEVHIDQNGAMFVRGIGSGITQEEMENYVQEQISSIPPVESSNTIANGKTKTDIIGLLKGNGTVVGQAEANRDYVTPEYISTNFIHTGFNDTDKGIILQSDIGGGTTVNNLISGYACVGTLGLITGVILDPFDSKKTLFENSNGFIFVHPEQYELASFALGKPIDTIINSTSNMSMMGFRIKALGTPVEDADAATKKYVDNFNFFSQALDGGTLNLTLNKENGSIDIQYENGLMDIINVLEIGTLIRFTFKGIETESKEFYTCIKKDETSWVLAHIGEGKNFIPQTITLTQKTANISLSFSGKPLLITLTNTTLTPPFAGAEGIVYNVTSNWAYDIKTLKVIYANGIFNTNNEKKVSFSFTEDNNHLMVILPED